VAGRGRRRRAATEKINIDQQARTSVFEDCVGGKANPRTEGNPSASDERRGAQAAHQQSAIQFWRVASRVSDARGREREN